MKKQHKPDFIYLLLIVITIVVMLLVWWYFELAMTDIALFNLVPFMS